MKDTLQGRTIPPIIANIVLNGLENVLANRFYSKRNGTIDKAHMNKHKINYVRFADDFVITTGSSEVAQEALIVVKAFLEPR